MTSNCQKFQPAAGSVMAEYTVRNLFSERPLSHLHGSHRGEGGGEMSWAKVPES